MDTFRCVPIEEPVRQRRVVPRVAPQACLRGEAIEVRDDVPGDRVRRLILGGVVASALAQAREFEIREMPGQDERHHRRLAGLERERPAKLAGERRSDRLGRLVSRRSPPRPRDVARLPAKQREPHRPHVWQRVERGQHGRAIAERDSPDSDVSPSAGVRVDDLEHALAPAPRPNVEVAKRHPVAVASSGRANDLAVHEQVEARLPRVIAAADPELNEVAVDREDLTGERAGRVVALTRVRARSAGVRVGHAFRVAADVALVRRDPLLRHRPRAKCGAFHLPAGEGVLVPVLEDDVRPRGCPCFSRLLHRAVEEGVPVADDAIAPGARRVAMIDQHGVLEPAGQRRLDVRLRRVSHGELHDRGGQARIIRLEGNEGREGLEGDGDRNARVPVFDRPDRVPSAEADVAKARAVERNCPAADGQREALLHRRRHLHRLGVVRRVGADVFVEDVPVPEPAVSAEVQLTSADAADRHADRVQFGAARDGRLAARRERGQPPGAELLVRRHQELEVAAAERPRHHRDSGGEQRHRLRSGEAQELAPFESRVAGTARSATTVVHRPALSR